jgi:hypothetical protein
MMSTSDHLKAVIYNLNKAYTNGNAHPPLEVPIPK